ncbi:MAG TPA: CAP domain-containing protein [Frankiaceae bacterium]|nr:CAP domain-containing protein [Frankiaceae bacterium]
MTRTPLRLALAAAALTTLAACNPLSAPATSTPTPAKPTEASTFEGRVLTLVNAERTKAHLKPLVLTNCADAIANSWSATMARTGTFTHQNLGPILTACKAHGAGENIGMGPVTADAMTTAWMNSPSHRANLLNPTYTGIGIGAVKTSTGIWYSTQDFIAP